MRKPWIFLIMLLTFASLATAEEPLTLTEFDSFYIAYPENAPQSVITRDIPQQGGQLDGVQVKVLEASYVGDMLRFLVVAEPERPGLSLVTYRNLNNPIEMEYALRFGDEVLAVHYTTDFPEGGLDGNVICAEWQGAAVFRFSRRLRKESPDIMTITLDLALIGRDMFEKVDTGKLTFDIPRTGTPVVAVQDVDIDLGHARVIQVAALHSPLDTIIQLTYEPVEAYGLPECTLLDVEGRYVPYEGHQIDLREDGSLMMMELKAEHMPAIPSTLYFRDLESSRDFAIDMRSGEVSFQ